MNSLWISLQFLVLILAELTMLFLAISTLVGLVFEYVSGETVWRWKTRPPLLLGMPVSGTLTCQ